MRERYENNMCRKVECEVCGESVMHALMARHKKSIKCKKEEIYKLSIGERLGNSQNFISRLPPFRFRRFGMICSNKSICIYIFLILNRCCINVFVL